MSEQVPELDLPELVSAHDSGSNAYWAIVLITALVVALALIGRFAFIICRSVPTTKVGRMMQVAVDLGRGMESFRARHGRYYPLTPTPEVYTPALEKKWANLLEFSPGAPASEMTITICAGDKGDVALPPCDRANPPTAEKRWFAVVVQRDMDGDGLRGTTVVYSNNGADPIEHSVGQ